MGSPLIPLPEELIPLARQKARAMTHRGLNRCDLEDLEQVLSLRAWLSLPSYSPQKGPLRAYLCTVMNRAASNFIRDQRACKRTPIHNTSLQISSTFGDGAATELAQRIGRKELDARTGGRSEDETVAIERDMDLKAFLRDCRPATAFW